MATVSRTMPMRPARRPADSACRWASSGSASISRPAITRCCATPSAFSLLRVLSSFRAPLSRSLGCTPQRSQDHRGAGGWPGHARDRRRCPSSTGLGPIRPSGRPATCGSPVVDPANGHLRRLEDVNHYRRGVRSPSFRGRRHPHLSRDARDRPCEARRLRLCEAARRRLDGGVSATPRVGAPSVVGRRRIHDCEVPTTVRDHLLARTCPACFLFCAV